ncbi:MAG: hypothetical protein ACE5HS_08375 [bacterium]
MSLLKELQLITERTYQMNSGINLEKFVIGRKRFRELNRFCGAETLELSDSARVFFRAANGKLFLAIYYSNEIISVLEKFDPRQGLHEKNIQAFVVFIEEINHSIHAALKFISGETEVQTEEFLRDLELLAKIDTYLILKFFLAYFNPSKQLENFDRVWLRFHLFERQNFDYESRRLAERYYQTNHLSEKYVRFLDSLPPKHRVHEIRRFRDLPYANKARYIQMLP